ncbi:DUF4350 domain-containing protein [Arthrobacter sp. NA-172]|uniref:DUF4350 domain-containing protein n=1 Tax=Arthrobacter sp. NA-172 TaxID=3367524 RepID=UPI0037544B3B
MAAHDRSGFANRMTPASVSIALFPAFEPPVDPNREEARRWAAEELSKAQYASAKPSWIDDIWNQFLEWLRSLNSGSLNGTNISLPVIGALAVVLIVVAVMVVRPRLNARRKESAEVFDGEVSANADVFRARASAAAAREDWQTAVVEQFRAVVRSAEDRAVIDIQAGRTADEAAAQLGRAFGTASSNLKNAAALFDGVKYGKAPATAADHASVLALDMEMSAMKPDFAGQARQRLGGTAMTLNSSRAAEHSSPSSAADGTPDRTPDETPDETPDARKAHWPALLRGWSRRHMAWIIIGGIVAVLGVVSVAESPANTDKTPLSARNPAPNGAMAAAEILRRHGVTVTESDAFTTTTSLLAKSPDATVLLYDRNGYLDSTQLHALLGSAGRVVVVSAGYRTLTGLGSGIRSAGVVPSGNSTLEPGCGQTDPLAAGPVSGKDGFLYTGADTICYRPGSSDGGMYAASADGRLVVLGSTALLSNGLLQEEGNAALAFRALGAAPDLIWYLPGLGDVPRDGSPPTLDELAPPWVGFLGLWLAVVAVLAVLWRGRRLGPLVFEPLPVVVKAAETAEGRARLSRTPAQWAGPQTISARAL